MKKIFLKELKMAEGRNTGVPLIVRAMKENGSKEPKFLTDEERSYFEIELPIHPIFTGHDKNTVKDDNVEIDKILSDTNHRTRRSREEIKELIIATLNREGNLSMNEIAESLGYTALTNTVRDITFSLNIKPNILPNITEHKRIIKGKHGCLFIP